MEALELLKSVWSGIVQIIQLLTPFALLWVTWAHTHKEKKIEKAENNEKRLEDEKYDKLLSSINGVTEALQKTEGDIRELRAELSRYKNDTDQLSKDLTHITMLNRMNGRYTHELAQLVMVIGEGIRDQHLDGNITKAIAKYRKFESDVLGSFVTGDDELPD